MGENYNMGRCDYSPDYKSNKSLPDQFYANIKAIPSNACMLCLQRKDAESKLAASQAENEKLLALVQELQQLLKQSS